MSSDELSLLLEKNYQRDLVARTMMFAAEHFDLFDFSDPTCSVFFAFIDGLLVDLTVTDTSEKRRTGHVNVKELGVTVLDAVMDLSPAGERYPCINEYTVGIWEKKIPIPAVWVVVSATG